MSTPSQLHHALARMQGQRVLCLGDVMLDRFIHGQVERISPEAPIPVFTAQHEESMLGGAGNVVRNLVGLGAQVSFLSVVGDDAAGARITALVGAEAGVVPTLILERGRISTRKTRYVAASQQMMRADHETRAAIDSASERKLLDAVLPEIAHHQAVLLSDYGKGVLTESLVRAVIAEAGAVSVPVFVDPKRRDVGVYAGATVLSPNLKELALAAGVETFTDTQEMVAAAQALSRRHGFQYVLVTRGAQGMSLVDAEGLVVHAAATARQVFDVSGAGDSVIATLAAAYAGGATMRQATELANLAGGVAVSRAGTAVVHHSDLAAALYTERAEAMQRKIIPRETIAQLAASWRREGMRVGFTNGCFDIMHAGHVSLLSDARAECDRLIVALNTDDSVQRLKGPTRPINAEMDRAQVIAAIAAVDAVVLFDEDTPLALIEELRPDVLMKGADYAREEVVGHAEVTRYGGRVVLLPLKAGYSTTGIIKKVAG